MRTIFGVCVALVALLPPWASAQSDADAALRFLRAGGAYCFRVAPEGVALSEETEWTLMLLTGVSNRKNTFRIRTVDPGPTRLSGQALAEVGEAVTGVWRQDSIREEFMDRFAAGISGKTLRARVVKIAPSNLARMEPRERAERYLEFADRGSRVSFDKTPDLTADEFRRYATYFPD